MKSVLSLCLTLLAIGQLTAQCIGFQNCPNSFDACDFTANDAGLWNETYWYDPINQIQDLSDSPVNVTLTATDTCAGASLTLRYLLFLDLDNNGTWETIVKSWDPPAPGTVNYNNWNNPNFEGGELRNFDQRAVPADGKYQFALETITTGNTTMANLRWNTQAAPNTFVLPQLPYGGHKIKWLAEDNLGENKVCEYRIESKDCKKPTVVCINGISVNMMPTGEITLWASDFLQYGEDNATPGNLLEYSIRKSGTGTGFPINPDGSPIPSVTFNCTELGTQSVELWVRDASDNADYCETYAIVQDALGNCNGGNISVPTVVCINGLSVNLPTAGQFQLWTSDLLQYAEDDNTPTNLLEFGIQICATGNSFPLDGNGHPNESLIFDCDNLGNQCVELWVKDFDGNTASCQVQVSILDNLNNCPGSGSDAPTLVCINGLSAQIMPTGFIQVWAADFLQYADDDNTPYNQLQFSLRRSGTGAGFPLDTDGIPFNNLTFDCDELGQIQVELWVKDLDGNTAYCETFLILEDNQDVCPGLVLLGTNTNLTNGSASILPPVPNPTSFDAKIPVRLSQAGQVRVEIADLSGKIILQRNVELNAGNHMLDIPAESMPQAGVYVWRVQSGSMTASGKLVKM